ncbi:MAG: hypothetical protein ACLQLC_21075 [Candidatus Sulfotelmatobacter sp.]
MEAISRIVADSLARHGLDRPVDPRRLQWSRWFRCDSPHSLLVVPSKPGIFALAEEVAELGPPASNATLPARRMLAVLQFSEDDDMAFTLDRMFTCVNPLRSRLSSGRCFLRFVVIEDQAQRRSICAALNQWMLNSAEKASGLPPDFSSSLEMAASVGRTPSSATTGSAQVASGANKNLHCSQPLPSGF